MSPTSPTDADRAGRVLTVLGAALILGVTLWPVAAPPAEVGSVCLLCGTRGLADGLLNVALFAPFGMGVALLAGPRSAVLLALLLSGAVEAAQLLRPDRYATLGDLVFNTAGGAAGAASLPLLRAVPRFLAHPPPAGRWAVRAASAGLILVPTALLVPSFPATEWYGQWTPALGHFETYRGRVLAARVGPLAFSQGRMEEDGAVRAALRAGEDLSVTFLAGPSPPATAVLAAIYDGEERQILMVGVRGADLVYFRRSPATALRLDHPGTGWRDALAGREGDTVRIRIARDRVGVGLSVDGAPERWAGLGAQDGWRVVLDPGPATLPPLLATVLGALWIAACSGPLGSVAGGWGRAAAGGLLLGAAALLASWSLPELAPHPAPLAGAAFLGAVGGHGLGRRLAAHGDPPEEVRR